MRLLLLLVQPMPIMDCHWDSILKPNCLPSRVSLSFWNVKLMRLGYTPKKIQFRRKYGSLPGRSNGLGRSPAVCSRFFARFDHPLSITTKSDLVCRDIDILRPHGCEGAYRCSAFCDHHSMTPWLGRWSPRCPTPQKTSGRPLKH